MQSLWILLFSAMLLIVPGHTLKCYQCTDCDSSAVSELEPKECLASLINTACYKLTYKENGISVTNRDCAYYIGDFNKVCDLITSRYTNFECHACNKDGCNAGNRLYTFSISALILSMIFVKVSF